MKEIGWFSDGALRCPHLHHKYIKPTQRLIDRVGRIDFDLCTFDGDDRIRRGQEEDWTTRQVKVVKWHKNINANDAFYGEPEMALAA